MRTVYFIACNAFFIFVVLLNLPPDPQPQWWVLCALMGVGASALADMLYDRLA